MDVLLIKDESGMERTVELLPGADALARLPSSCEVYELLQALNLEEQVGLLTLVMEQPRLRIAVSQMKEALTLFGTTIGTLAYFQGLLVDLFNLRETESTQVAILQQQMLDLQAELHSLRDLNTRQAATITELQQQLEVQMQENMAPPHMDLGFLDDGLLEPQPSGAQEQSTALAVPRSPRQAEAEHNAREMAALAAAAQQDKALLEARMHTQEESFQNEANWMAMETQLAERKAQEMAAAAAAARQDKAAIEARMMEQDDLYENHITWMTTETKQLQQQVQEKTAAAAVVQRERDLLEMHMEDQQDMFDHQMTWMTTENEEVKAAASAAEERARQLQEQLHRSEDSCTSLFEDLTSEQAARTEAEQRLAECKREASKHVDTLTTFALEQTKAMEAAEVERVILRSRLAALVELQPRESIAADLSSDGSSVNPNPIPTDPAALASPGSGSASAGAPVQAASQAEEAEREIVPFRLPTAEEQHSHESVTAGIAPPANTANPRPVAPADPPAAASISIGGASADANVQSASEKPRGLIGAAITSAAFATALGDVAVMIGTAAAQHLLKSAASALFMPL